MANKLATALTLIAGTILAGCVSVDNRDGLNPPVALCSNIRGTIGVPKGAVPVAGLKSARTDATVHFKEWIFTGLSAGMVDMTLQNALANSGLKKVYYADYEQTSYLGFVTVFNVTAYGE